ncbi:hypothetical protein IW261DRAFT_1423694 [Armillaria novae-zelandiae]|uniref:Uncharacterized protein n=1 Tax=Armillaria novae-zelandiae TaxID=153914 RepID=A0AA39U8Q7_9AGAR|nr:hypothetical protein IW261DRAFT_1423694 [Armillaria novae-zelandiae]
MRLFFLFSLSIARPTQMRVHSRILVSVCKSTSTAGAQVFVTKKGRVQSTSAQPNASRAPRLPSRAAVSPLDKMKYGLLELLKRGYDDMQCRECTRARIHTWTTEGLTLPSTSPQPKASRGLHTPSPAIPSPAHHRAAVTKLAIARR